MTWRCSSAQLYSSHRKMSVGNTMMEQRLVAAWKIQFDPTDVQLVRGALTDLMILSTINYTNGRAAVQTAPNRLIASNSNNTLLIGAIAGAVNIIVGTHNKSVWRFDYCKWRGTLSAAVNKRTASATALSFDVWRVAKVEDETPRPLGYFILFARRRAKHAGSFKDEISDAAALCFHLFFDTPKETPERSSWFPPQLLCTLHSNLPLFCVSKDSQVKSFAKFNRTRVKHFSSRLCRLVIFVPQYN